MAELIIGAVGLVALENTVNRFFAKAATWRHHGQDLEQYSLSLALAGISYERWKRSVKLIDSSTDLDTTNMLVASGDEASTVVWLLQAIQSAFEDAEKTTGRYEDDISQSLTITGDVRMDDLSARASAVNQARQSSANPWQKMRWVFHDEEKLRKLEQTVSANIGKLVKIFPPAAREDQERFAAMDLDDIVPPAAREASSRVLTAEKSELAKVRDVAATVDSIMQEVAGDAIRKVGQRHTFHRNLATGDSKVLYGDQRTGDRGQVMPGSLYTENKASERAQAQYGDRENMADFFK